MSSSGLGSLSILPIEIRYEIFDLALSSRINILGPVPRKAESAASIRKLRKASPALLQVSRAFAQEACEIVYSRKIICYNLVFGSRHSKLPPLTITNRFKTVKVTLESASSVQAYPKSYSAVLCREDSDAFMMNILRCFLDVNSTCKTLHIVVYTNLGDELKKFPRLDFFKILAGAKGLENLAIRVKLAGGINGDLRPLIPAYLSPCGQQTVMESLAVYQNKIQEALEGYLGVAEVEDCVEKIDGTVIGRMLTFHPREHLKKTDAATVKSVEEKQENSEQISISYV